MNNKILAFSHYDFPVWYHYREQELPYIIGYLVFFVFLEKTKLIYEWFVWHCKSDIFFLSLAHNIYRNIPVQKTHPFIIFFIVICIRFKYIISVGVCNLKVFLAMISDMIRISCDFTRSRGNDFFGFTESIWNCVYRSSHLIA